MLAGIAVGAHGIAQAASDPAPPAPPAVPLLPARVPLRDNFSRLELVTTGVVAAAGIVMLGFAERLVGTPVPSLGPPGAGSFDRVWSDRLHLADGSGGRFLGGVPDFAGLFVLPYAPAAIYAIDTIAISRDGAPWLFGDSNPDHRLVAYAEALGWTSLVTGVTKVLVGRERPYVVLDHPELAGPARERNLSFFSGHSAMMFAAASFVARDASARLTHGPLAQGSAHGGAARWWLGSFLPYVVSYGVASLVAVSRVIDQQHWPSDVVVGALVGTTIGHLAYLAHFDEDGQPRQTSSGVTPAPPAAYDVRLIPTVGGMALVGLFP